MARHKWSISNYKGGRVVDGATTQCLVCGIYRQYVKGRAEYWRGDNHLPKRPTDCNLRLGLNKLT